MHPLPRTHWQNKRERKTGKSTENHSVTVKRIVGNSSVLEGLEKFGNNCENRMAFLKKNEEK